MARCSCPPLSRPALAYRAVLCAVLRWCMVRYCDGVWCGTEVAYGARVLQVDVCAILSERGVQVDVEEMLDVVFRDFCIGK
eukprot:3158599-Rhodomonas_salina.1